MIRSTRDFREQLRDLLSYYLEVKNRPEAARLLQRDVLLAIRRIAANPTGGVAFPGPYPEIGAIGLRWILVRANWFGWKLTDGVPVVTNVLYQSSNMVRRVSRSEDDVTDW